MHAHTCRYRSHYSHRHSKKEQHSGTDYIDQISQEHSENEAAASHREKADRSLLCREMADPLRSEDCVVQGSLVTAINSWNRTW